VETRLERALPAWPVLTLLWGMPLFWASGLLPFSTIILAVPMFAFLLRSGQVRLVPGTLPYVGFVVWMLPCALMLDSISRVAGSALRFGQYAAVAVALVYVVSARRSLPAGRVLAGLTFTWVFVILGGYLGLLWPEVTLNLTVGRLLPGSLLENEYVSDLVFPPFSEVQTPYGAEEPFLRPAAPFAYTNGWGAAMAILTPVAVGYALQHSARRVKVLVAICAVAAIPPSLATTNRGLFLGLIAVTGYVLLRLLFRGALLPFLSVAVLGVVVTVVLVLSGLVDDILARQDTANTTEGRGDLYVETFERTLLSPILGYGAPRPSFTSEISVGTQGAVWNAMFSFGFVGLGLLLLFLVGGVLRTWSAPSVPLIWLHASLVGACVISTYYGLDRHMLVLCLLLGVMLRERYTSGSTFWRAPRLSAEAATNGR
jgi:hypothetical protein